MHIYTHTLYMNSHIHTYIICTYKHTRIHKYVHTFIHTYIHTYIQCHFMSYIHTYIHINIHTDTNTYIHNTHTHIYHTYTYIHIHIYTSHTKQINSVLVWMRCFEHLTVLPFMGYIVRVLSAAVSPILVVSPGFGGFILMFI